MSLINKMLVDLETRTQGVATGGKTVFQDLHPAMGARRYARNRVPLWSGLAAAAVVAIGAAWYLGQQTGQRVSPPRAVAPSPMSAYKAPKATAKAAETPAASVSQPNSAPVAAAATTAPQQLTLSAPMSATVVAASAPPASLEHKQASTPPVAASNIEVAPSAAPPVTVTATPKLAARPTAAAKSAPPATASATDQAALTSTDTAARMEKTPRVLTPEQQAEQAFRVATAAFNRQAFTEAEGGFSKALGLQPTHTGAREGLAALLMHTGRSDEAQALLRAGRAVLPRHYPFVQLLARAYIARGDDRAALDLLQQARGIAGHDPEYWAFVATAHQRLQQHQEAVQNYRAAVRLQPAAARAWIGMGISLEALKDTASAQTAYRAALDGQGLDLTLIRFAEQRLAALRR